MWLRGSLWPRESFLSAEHCFLASCAFCARALVSLWPQDSSPVRREQPEGGPSSPGGGHLAFSLLPALLSCFGLHPASPSDVMVFSLSSRPGGPLVTLMCAWGPAACLQTAFSIHFLLPRPEWPWCFYQSQWQDQAGRSDVLALVL